MPPLSVLDLPFVTTATPGAVALGRNSLDPARLADHLSYRRCRVAEHHNLRSPPSGSSWIARFVLAAALGLNAASAQASVEKYDVKGAGATTDPFFTRDPSGCVVTSVRLGAFEEVTRQAGPPVPASMIFLSVYKANECTGEILLSADASQALADEDLVVQGNLHKATLVTRVGVHDQVCECTIPIEVDLTWTAIGPVDASRVHERFVSPGGSVSLRSDSSDVRQATVVGAVSAGSTNFARDMISISHIGAYKFGTITQTKF